MKLKRKAQSLKLKGKEGDFGHPYFLQAVFVKVSLFVDPIMRGLFEPDLFFSYPHVASDGGFDDAGPQPDHGFCAFVPGYLPF